jgi:hypothetical protein
MKKLLLLLVLVFPIFVMAAEWLPGTVTMNDGTEKEGLIQLPKRHDQDEISFKANEKAKKQDLSVDDVKEFTVNEEDDKKIRTFKTIKLANLKGLSAKLKISDKKSWVEMVWEGKINIMTAYVMSSMRQGPVYYVQKENEDYCRWLSEFYGSLTINEFKGFQGMVDFTFKDVCPELAASFTKDDFKNKGVEIVGINYDKLCGKAK